MPTLYSQQRSNVWKTWVLMTGFFLLIIAVGWVFSLYYGDPSIIMIAAIFSIISSIGSYWFSDKIVLSMTGAHSVTEKEFPDLYHTVENLCISVGMPMPNLYIINEQQPNAFATGRNEKHAVIAVTTGLLNRLEKIEIEGVLAHELAHIKNKDMLLQTVVVVMAGLLSIVSELFLRNMFWGGKDRDNKINPVILVLAIVAAILAPLAATIIQLSISRKREFLADATGALITRYPDGLADALRKISEDPHEMAEASNATAHLYISSPLRGESASSWFSKLFMTHPPVGERIAALKGMDVKKLEEELYGKKNS